MEKNLGHATAYGYAKSKGYSGTEEEFAQLMADYASVGQSAAQSASEAAASATSASGSAATASQAAQTATTKASDAIIAEGVATAKAEDAQAYATSANQSAESASTSAQIATTAATTATTKASEAAASEAAALSAKTDAETARDAAAQSASRAEQSAESIDPDEFDRKIYAAFATDSASGAIAHFEDGADSIPLKSLKVNIEPVQSGSGDPSPDNVRPISGWDAVNVAMCGKNLCPTTTITLGNGSPRTAEVYFAKPLPIGTYTFSASVTINTVVSNPPGVQFISTSGTNIMSATMAVGTTGTLTKTITVTDPILRLYFYLGTTDYNNGKTIVFENIQVEVGSTATAYEPYTAQTYPVTLPTEAGTVYGGTLDVVSGVLTVDRAFKVFNGTEHWEFSSTSIRPNIKITDIAYKGAVICNMYPYSPVSAAIEGTIGTNGGNGYNIWIKDSINGDSLANWKTFLATNNLQVVYELATPITYHLTPQEITSLLGTNNLWADTGDTEVEYRVDTALYISRLTEPDADMIADANIVSGQYFMVGNNLYRATSNIASGASVIVGTNAIKVSLATALNEINQQGG